MGRIVIFSPLLALGFPVEAAILVGALVVAGAVAGGYHLGKKRKKARI
jgi:hypothetical protein